jgi:hypothetical protein
MRVDEEKIKAVEKLLKEPVAAEFSPQAWKVRTNLIIASAIALAMGLAKIRIAADSTFLGLKFEGLNDIVVRVTLATVIVYLLFHFIWVGWDAFLEWRLRITGTRTAFQTGSFFSPPHVDHPVDPRQSTLYNWWTQQNRAIANVGIVVDQMQEEMKTWEGDIQAIREGKSDPYSQNLNQVVTGLSQVNVQYADLTRAVKANTDAITDDRIPTSLRRFDGWFELFQRSQNLRWFVIEFVAPVALSVAALYQLSRAT